ncbi:MAG: hydrogenase maturation protease [Ignisphaera sp.]|nr:hydrogenase maturation protease [Ignisphaera sp.]MCX8167870.1 hydrogenase maturation protease [Ignisphaera sp.]MDW8085489.1 hydrogenase maturation protease [Ignisphaera sp.]
MRVLSRDDACRVLKAKLVDNFTIVCVGSELRSDDMAALEFCRKLRGIKPFRVIICEYGVENCIGEIVDNNIKKIVLMDAAIIGGLDPASIVVLDLNEVGDYMPLSTHTLPLPLLLKFIIEELKDVEIVIVGIVVNKLDIDTEMSPQVRNLISSLVDCLSK